jgi:CHAT domain-containing protein
MLVGREHSPDRRDGSAEGGATVKAESKYFASVAGVGRDFFLTTEEAGSADGATKILRKMSETLGLGHLLSTLPRRVRALTIVPDDSLHGFPFSALIHCGKFLVEHYALSLAFESGVMRPPARRPDGGRGLLVGVSRGGVTEDGKQFPPLPGVSEEVESLEGWLSSQSRLPTVLLKDGEATRATVLEQLPGATFVHMACHGIFEPDRPDASGLVLVPVAGRAEVLSLRELSALDLTGLRHVGLSFCWSADNFVLPGRWIISLPETIWRAGSQSVLGHFWRVNDSLAVAFTRRFYENALTNDLDQAVRLTQLECLAERLLPDEYGIDTKSPVHWAGYHLYGDPGRLRLG